jgi:8-oxo-dGTP pyrophosphatase MutT (NUDIX family)
MTEFQKFIEGLKIKLARPLPGLHSQLKMASITRQVLDGKVVIPDNVRKAGVLVLFYPSKNEIFIAFIKRTEYPGVHSGQVAFPGGGWEEQDKDLTATALREAEEEIGVARQTVNILGKLSDLFIPPSNFLVSPMVGYTMTKPDFVPEPEEVDSVLEIPLKKLLDTDSKQDKEIHIFPDINITVPCYYVDGHVIWGATAMMLSELIDIVNPGS